MSQSVTAKFGVWTLVMVWMISCGHSDDDSDGESANASTANGTNNHIENVNQNDLDEEQNSEGDGSSIPTLLPPTSLSAGISFEDSDIDYDELEGDITFTKANDESNISQYALYWGTSATTKLSATPLQTIAKTGSDLVVSLPADTPVPLGATHFLIYSQNDVGESTSATSLHVRELVQLTETLSGGGNDWFWAESGGLFSNGGTTLSVNGTNNYAVGLRFQNVTIPQGATLETAYIRVVFTSYATNSVTIVGHNADTGASCANAAECDALVVSATSASASWGPLDNNILTGIILPSVEIKSIITEITARAGWTQGQDITLLLTNATGSGVTNIAAFENIHQKSELFLRYTRNL